MTRGAIRDTEVVTDPDGGFRVRAYAYDKTIWMHIHNFTDYREAKMLANTVLGCRLALINPKYWNPL